MMIEVTIDVTLRAAFDHPAPRLSIGLFLRPT
jgi:hypothetical protein